MQINKRKGKCKSDKFPFIEFSERDLYNNIMDVKTLGELCNIVAGGTPSRSNVEFWENGTIPWIKIGNIKGKYIQAPDEFITQKGLDNSSAKMLPKGTVLYTIFATLGEVGILNIDACTNQAIAGLTIKDEKQLNTDYLYYYLVSKKTYVNTVGRGVAQNNINMSILRSFKLPLLPICEQKKIVKILDKVNDLRNGYQLVISSLDNLIKARFVEMFGDVGTGKYNYETCKLGEVTSIGSSHRVFTSEFVEKGIPFYRGTEIAELASGNKPVDPYYISEEHYQRLVSDNTRPQVGDLLMPSICNKGQVWMVDTEEPFYYKDGRVLCISPDRTVFNSKFLQYFMREKTMVEYPKMGSGSTFAEFKIFLLKDMDVLVPPKELQNQFADFVNQVNKSKVAVQKSLDETQLLFDSLMQKYFG